MKLQIIKSPTLAAIVFSFMLSGCLKDKAFDSGAVQPDHNNGSQPKIIEIKTNASSTYNFYTVKFPGTKSDTVVNFIPINLATNDVASEDIHVTLVQNDQLIDDYNNNPNFSTFYTVPTPDLVTILNPGNVVVIPKGQHTGYLQIKFNPFKLLGTPYALGFTIKSIKEPGYIISGNAQSGIGGLIAKNQYDGVYLTKGRFVHPIYAGTWTFADDVEQTLATTGSNSVEGLPLSTVNAQLGAPLDIAVNADNTLSIILNGTPEAPNPANRYDPATKTFYVTGHYSTRRLVDTLVFLHP